ncbi:Acetone carboxylase beta subunit [uncultured Eubacterium sp.]|nr:Acetone carboxylase beta subunit [uncultured Eubacterium sp.]
MAYVLGIDTGGTNTDCALLDSQNRKVVASSKAATTKKQLSKGIATAIDKLNIPPGKEIALVCLSTTLATNAIVEQTGCRTGIILIGKTPEKPLPSMDYKLIRGKLDIRGRETVTMSEDEIRTTVREMSKKVEAIAVSGFASVRNPIQELRVREIIEQECSLPAFCAHQLTGTLGFWERTVTCSLNASLVKIIYDFITETKSALLQKHIKAPLMVVRSDGTLMTESVAMKRPIETILSGPAASILGARYLTGLSDALILDMGGTTTDIAQLQNGTVRLNPEGARVNGWLTRCKAADVTTYGIGGDSCISFHREGQIQIGPKRALPRCFADSDFARPYLTPTDILHITGDYVVGNKAAAKSALREFSQRCGQSDNETLRAVYEKITKKLALACIQASADFEGHRFSFHDDPAASFLLDKAFICNSEEFLRTEIHLQQPVIAVGAPVSAWLPAVIEKLHCKLIIPDHAEVANAIGAAVAQFSETVECLIRPKKGDTGYLVYLPDHNEDFCDYQTAVEYGKTALRDHLKKLMQQYGVTQCHIEIDECPVYTTNFACCNKKVFVETKITASTTCKPV